MSEIVWNESSINSIFMYLNTQLGEDISFEIEAVERNKYPISGGEADGKIIYVPGYLNLMGADDGKAMVGICYAGMYMRKYYTEIINGEKCISKPPLEMTLKVWRILNLSHGEGIERYDEIVCMMEEIIRPLRRAYYTDLQDKCYFSVGDTFRDGITRRQVTDIIEKDGDIFVAHKGISPANDKIVTYEESKLFDQLTRRF